MHAPSDEQLMAEVKDGDIAAFESLVDRHKGSVFSLAYGMLRSREDAEEAGGEETAERDGEGADSLDGPAEHGSLEEAAEEEGAARAQEEIDRRAEGEREDHTCEQTPEKCADGGIFWYFRRETK